MAVGALVEGAVVDGMEVDGVAVDRTAVACIGVGVGGGVKAGIQKRQLAGQFCCTYGTVLQCPACAQASHGTFGASTQVVGAVVGGFVGLDGDGVHGAVKHIWHRIATVR